MNDQTQKKFSTQSLRGFEDFYPSKLRVMKWILEKLKKTVETYCYEEYEGPTLEPIEIFAAKSSDELVYEQSFYVEKKKGEKLILIPEITPTLARMIAKKEQEFKKPIRWYSCPKLYRYERPQRGRKREFYQFNMDILGEESLYAELEIFEAIIDFLTGFGATAEQFQIYYNNRRFIDSLCEILLGIPKEKMPDVYHVLDKAEKMDESEFEKFVIDTFQNELVIQGIFKIRENNSVQELLEKFEKVPEELYESTGYKEIVKLEKLIKETNIEEYCAFSSSVVRGLDYYTGTVFEVFDTGEKNRRAIFGGGRYDDLLSLFTEEQLSGIGFGMGVLMLKLFLDTYNLIPEEISKKNFSDTLYIASINEQVASYALKVAQRIRAENIACMIDYRFDSLSNQLSKANDLGIGISIIIGPREMENGQVTVKNMATEEQKTIQLDNLVKEIKDQLVKS
ncbi:MAG: Histidine--tRNA ligase [Promethearchaeota archaeon]|nr:MAG: Histidine--tRNA ligase [Candidatus Lokiarchaeota archaeon]